MYSFNPFLIGLIPTNRSVPAFYFLHFTLDFQRKPNSKKKNRRQGHITKIAKW